MRFRWALVALSLASATSAQALDCSRARSPAERGLCASAELRQLDAALNTAYRAARQGGASAWMLPMDQTRWLREVRDPCQQRETCLREALRARTAVLQAWHERRPVPDDPAGHYGLDKTVPVVNGHGGHDPMAGQDCLSITPLGAGRWRLHLSSVQANAHTCSFTGEAQREGDALVARADAEADPEARCSLHLRFHPAVVIVHAPSPACRDHCGARASLHGVVLRRPPQPPDAPGACRPEGPF